MMLVEFVGNKAISWAEPIAAAAMGEDHQTNGIDWTAQRAVDEQSLANGDVQFGVCDWGRVFHETVECIAWRRRTAVSSILMALMPADTTSFMHVFLHAVRDLKILE